ncbi:MAG: hypothetical protein KKD10_00480, partial [Candidatus Omnitrophica bacterium]|nr:hypothetical protein [Candidatus Omnitrophota bacterium]
MKKLIGLLIVVGIVLIIWFQYSSAVKNAREGPQGTPEKTASNFMASAEKVSNLIWKQEENEKVKNLLKEWKNVDEEDTEKQKEMMARFKEMGIENPKMLFKDENYAKTAFSVLCLFEFGDYEIGQSRINDNKAEVEVSFLPADFLGLKSTMGGLTDKKPSQRTE